MYWWQVKVYQERSHSTTNISMWGKNEDALMAQLEDEYVDDDSWVFVSARLEDE